MGKSDIRREGILTMLRTKGLINIPDLVNQFSCSEATVRRDLRILESEKKLIRTLGGAILEDIKTEIPFFKKQEYLVAQKMEIADKAVKLIEEGDVIGLTGGSTTYYIAQKVRNFKKLTVLTNAINIAYELAGVEGIQVIVTGGVLRSQSFELCGPMADTTLSKIIIQKMFVGADGASLQRGITTFNELEANTNRVMMDCAIRNYVVIDNTKFNTSSLFVIVNADQVEGIITDSGIDTNTLKQFRQSGVEIF